MSQKVSEYDLVEPTTGSYAIGYNGTTMERYDATAIAPDHNNLNGLQGGDGVGGFYHVPSPTIGVPNDIIQIAPDGVSYTFTAAPPNPGDGSSYQVPVVNSNRNGYMFAEMPNRKTWGLYPSTIGFQIGSRYESDGATPGNGLSCASKTYEINFTSVFGDLDFTGSFDSGGCYTVINNSGDIAILSFGASPNLQPFATGAYKTVTDYTTHGACYNSNDDTWYYLFNAFEAVRFYHNIQPMGYHWTYEVVGEVPSATNGAVGQTIVVNTEQTGYEFADSLSSAVADTAPVDTDEVISLRTTPLKTTWANIKTFLGLTFAQLAGSVSQAFSAASLTNAGNLTFTGTGARITGDMSTTTVLNRPCFQSNVTDGATFISAIPNGAGTSSQLVVYSSSTPQTSGAGLNFKIDGTASSSTIASFATGSGTGLPLTFKTTSTGTSTIERMRMLTGTNTIVLIGATTTSTTEALQVTGAAYVSTTIKQGTYTVATLPTGAAGMRSFVTDANATTFAAVVAGGGANGVPVYHDGTNWRIG